MFSTCTFISLRKPFKLQKVDAVKVPWRRAGRDGIFGGCSDPVLLTALPNHVIKIALKEDGFKVYSHNSEPIQLTRKQSSIKFLTLGN